MYKVQFYFKSLISFLLFSGVVYTQDLQLVRFTSPIQVDGYLRETAWKSATKIEDFYSYYPIDGIPAQEKTIVLLGYDDNSVYIAFVCFDKNPELIRATISSRDDIFDDDHVVLMIDTFNKGKEAYEFAFNPFGIQLDGIYIDMEAEDLNPDYVFYSSGQRFKQGYIVEAEIPFKSLRFPSGANTWAIALLRSIKHLDTDYIWPPISRNSTTFVPHFAKIKGMGEISHRNNLEILPEFTTTHRGVLDKNTREFEKGELQFQGGLNLKYGLSSDLTFDFTYNPDFSQIEADADKIDVNRRFPLYYDEKRPFFLEGTNIFQTPINAVYTRQIVDPLAGFKMSGKIGEVEVGFLSSIDDYYGSPDYVTDQAGMNPLFSDSAFSEKYRGKKSIHSIVRIKKEVWDYSHIGFLLTDKHFGDSYSTTYGLDGKLLISEEYNFTFQLLNAYSKHLFVSEQKTDPAIYASIFRGSRTFNFQIFYNDVFENFEAANGFLPYRSLNRLEYREGGINASYDFLSDVSFLRVFRPSVYITRMFNHDGDRIESYFAPTLALEMEGSNTLLFTFYRQFEEYSGYNFDKNWFYTQIDSKTLPWLFFHADLFFGDAIYYESIYYGINPFLGKFQSLSFGLDFKPFKNWSSQLSFSNYNFEGIENTIEYSTKQDIFRIRSIYQFTNEISIRIIAEHNNFYKDLDINMLFSYNPSPGTVLFFGYNDYFEKSGFKNFRRSARGIFTKISYLFRL